MSVAAESAITAANESATQAGQEQKKQTQAEEEELIRRQVFASRGFWEIAMRSFSTLTESPVRDRFTI